MGIEAATDIAVDFDVGTFVFAGDVRFIDGRVLFGVHVAIMSPFSFFDW